jgi:non-ribosomal peptide synthetase component E (peptide arylation enzyme)
MFVSTMPMNAIGKIDRKGMTSRVAAMVSEANTAAE